MLAHRGCRLICLALFGLLLFPMTGLIWNANTPLLTWERSDTGTM